MGALALGVTALLGCVAGAAGADRLLSWAPPPGQSCRPAERPASLPTPAEIADTAALRAAVDGARTVLSVSFDSTGAPSGARLIEADLTAGAAVALAEGVKRVLRPQPAGPSFRVILAIDDAGVGVGRAESCPPALANPRDVEQALREGLIAHRRAHPGYAPPPHPTVVDVFVDTLGVVTETRVQQLSGDAAADRIALDAARGMRFHPARLDSRPVPVWSRLPVQLRLEAPRAQQRGG
jgi:TonB family protein